MNRKKSTILLLIFLLGTLAVNPPKVLSVQAPTIISLALPDWTRDRLSEDVFSQFESEHPGVQVQVVHFDGSSGPYAIPSAAFGLTDHLQQTRAYISSADVLYIKWDGAVPIEATRAGYLLNLAPLTGADTALNPDDFVPAAWQSVQWDNGVWALPLAVTPQMWVYDPAVFDAAGLTYPDERWGIQEIANSARLLTQWDSSNNVIVPGMMVLRSQKELLLRSLLGHGIFDNANNPSVPRLADSDLIALLDSWAELEQEGVTGKTFAGTTEQLPLSIGTSWSSATSDALLPGGVVGLQMDGLSVSGYTAYPELAYELSKYLTYSPQFLGIFEGSLPARQNLVTSVSSGFQTSPEDLEAIRQALSHALPLSELRYMDYVLSALSKMNNNDIGAENALLDVQALATDNLRTATEQFNLGGGNVTTPVMEAPASSGEISLTFGINTTTLNPDRLNQLAQEFSVSDPQVGQIVFYGGDSLVDRSDCFYLPYSDVSDQTLTHLLNLDPLLDADSSFDRSDLVGGVLNQLTAQNRVWGYPLNMQPYVLWYNVDLFASLGIVPSQESWTVDAFSSALQTLKSNSGNAPFKAQGNDDTYLLMLMAAYGGIPLDYRVSPPAVNTTDPTTIAAVQQVLDLAKSGYIAYKALNKADSPADAVTPLFAAPLNGFVSFSDAAYRPILFPRGNQFAPISYVVGTAYINASTPYPEACYRWISTLAQHPELFPAMPVRRSLINDPITLETHGQAAVEIYNQIDALLQLPETVAIPPMFIGAMSWDAFLLHTWLDRVFDQYVLQAGSLEDDLAQVKSQVTDYRNCLSTVAPLDPANPSPYFDAAKTCAWRVDPLLAEQ